MDPRLRQVLLVLLQLVIEQEAAPQRDPLDEPAPEKDVSEANPKPGTLRYDLSQLTPSRTHYAWPPALEHTHDFGGP
jgi:hypothetical protein